MVEDGSPDRCPEICDRWAGRDSRIRVIHQENQGLGMARNTAMAQARGEYLCFVDSDDFLLPEAVATVVSAGAEVVVAGFWDVSPEGRVLQRQIPRGKETRYEGQAVQEIFLPRLLSGQWGLHPGVCWGGFSMELVQRANWRFPSEKEIICEDIYALLGLYAHVKCVAVVPKAVYAYRKETASLSRHYREDRFEQAKKFYEKSRELCRTLKFPAAVEAGCREPYLGLTLLAMKQAPGEQLQRMLEDALWQQTAKEVHGGNWKRRLFFRAAGRKRYRLCRWLLAAARRRERWKMAASGALGLFGRGI